MACGLPVVMTPCEGSKELVQGNGVIVSVDEMGNALSDLIRDEHKLTYWGKESRRRVEKFFSWDSIVKMYLQLMEEKLNNI